MDLQEIETHIDKRTGLVPLVIVQPYAPYQAGQIAGFPAAAAVIQINSGIARLPAKADMKAKAAVAPEPAPVHGDEVMRRAHAYDQQPELSPRAQTAPGSLQNPPAPMPPAAIPEGWESFSGAQLRSLAANLSGQRYQEISAERAVEIIRAEITRSSEPAAALAPAHATVPGAITSASLPTGDAPAQQAAESGNGTGA